MYFVFVYICFCKYLSVKKEGKEEKMEKKKNMQKRRKKCKK